MKLKIKIRSENAAFQDYPGELERIRAVAIEKGRSMEPGERRPLMDINGNTVGYVERAPKLGRR